jgi:hypothetical protein
MAMGSSLSPIVSNICMDHFEKLALDPHNINTTMYSMLVSYLWSGLMAQTGYRISSATSIFEGLPSSSTWKRTQTV